MAMKCESCGTTNPEGMRFCGNCGRPLLVSSAGISDARTRNCVACGRPIGWDAIICMYCGHDYRDTPKKGTEGHLLTGAILTILAGVLGFLLLVSIYFDNDIFSLWGSSLGLLSLSCTILGVIGGVAALVRRWFPVAVLGAGAAIFTPAFFFAIPGLILIANSATRFKDYVDKN